MDDARLTKRVFLHDYNMCSNNWCSDIKQLMRDIGISSNFEDKTVVNLSDAKLVIQTKYEEKWARDLQNTPKLRTYKTFKQNLRCEEYVQTNLSKYERSLFCQFRIGILPLRIETGRYTGEPPEQRHWAFSTGTSVEHFLSR